MKVAVLGAGTVGLNTALEFQRKYPSADITVLAEKFNQDTTSDGAAGLILPSSSFMGPSKEITQEWMKNSFAYYKYLMENTSAGVIWMSGYIFSNESQEVCENHYMKSLSPDYRPATPEELLREGGGHFKFGLHLSTMVVPCRKVLPWSIQRFEEGGGKVVQKKIDSLDSLTRTYNVIFNCTGMGAKYLCNDTEMVPIRGQILQVQAPWVKHFYINDFMHYMIPVGYNNMVTLGGTQDFGSYNRVPDEHTSSSILEHCSKFGPNISNLPVVRTWVGLRPYRSRVRVEIEGCKDSIVVHNYGHGGYGVTTSPGSAQYAVQLFTESHRATSGSKLKSKM